MGRMVWDRLVLVAQKAAAPHAQGRLRRLALAVPQFLEVTLTQPDVQLARPLEQEQQLLAPQCAKRASYALASFIRSA